MCKLSNNPTIDILNKNKYKYFFLYYVITTMETIETDVERMIQAKHNLDGLHIENQNVEYKLILSMVNAYLNKHCIHSIITDLIDITAERSQIIHYCEKCNLIFDQNR